MLAGTPKGRDLALHWVTRADCVTGFVPVCNTHFYVQFLIQLEAGYEFFFKKMTLNRIPGSEVVRDGTSSLYFVLGWGLKLRVKDKIHRVCEFDAGRHDIFIFPRFYLKFSISFNYDRRQQTSVVFAVPATVTN